MKTAVDDAARIVAGTVGDDVLTVHRLRVLDESTGDRRALCGAGGPQSETDEWSRAVNCPDCLAAPTE
ncbi:hypothetical protein [Streptomyces buecherae]|uniref:Uncharacterized protein n=1 Tax=Streptomyces buecherae TaxID=2763006 RepID=A0A7H8NCL6_9ACTN|nr:hypothetical protein [Streptomyces buecherae]QKW51508.1 hypothetical protein HUT08_20440 [Streptomyces buecherae]